MKEKDFLLFLEPQDQHHNSSWKAEFRKLQDEIFQGSMHYCYVF